MTEKVPPWAPVPGRYLYVQLADHLQARIAAGDFPPGSRLPGELELRDEYGVAYHTVRGAIGVLRERGVVETLRGLGTFIPVEDDSAPPQ